jgi:hypothetical protein
MGWWWKLTVEWPGMIGDWLWKLLVAMPVASLRDMTVRRIFTALALAVLVGIFVQTLPVDFAYLVAGDMLTYLEAIAIVGLLVARGRGRDMIRMLGQMARGAVRRSRKTIDIAFRRTEPRRRGRSHACRIRRFGRSKNTDDAPGLARTGRSRSYPVGFGRSSGGVCALRPWRSSSAHASSAVSAKLNRARSVASTVPCSTSASKFTMRCQ